MAYRTIVVERGVEEGPTCPDCGGTLKDHWHSGVQCVICGHRFSIEYEDDIKDELS